MSSIRSVSFGESTQGVQLNGDSALCSAAELIGRILLSILFLMSGIGKIGAYAATAGYMASVGVPGALLPLAIVVEVIGAIALIVGWKIRWVSFLLAGYTLITGLLFHNNFGNPTETIMFLKNLSITGAFLVLAANGAGRFSVDARNRR